MAVLAQELVGRPSHLEKAGTVQAGSMPRGEVMMMEWNGFSWRSQGYERSSRLSEEKKNYPFTLLHGPLSARGERQSHPLAGQAQACGRPTQVEGPGGPMAPVVATG